MRKHFITMLGLAVFFIAMIGCEREVTETIFVDDSDDCFECHGDDGILLQAKGEWQNSTHASGTNVDYTNRGGSDCTQCHNHQGFLEFLATGEVQAPYDNVSAIHCFTCHAPHERGDLTLRTTDPVALVDGSTFDYGDGNLCVACHKSRRDPSGITDDFTISSSHWGPHHGPQGDVMDGTLGYEYSGYTYENTNHASAIEKQCVTCHMGNPRTHSGYGVGGHSFNIVDDEGNSIAGVCSDCHSAADAIDFTADADYDFDGVTEGYQTEIVGLVDSLGLLLYNQGLLSDPVDGHPVRNFVVADGGVAGALWNYLVVIEDQSKGTHNFKYLHGLLQSSIEYINSAK